jgi:hypothetical protein
VLVGGATGLHPPSFAVFLDLVPDAVGVSMAAPSAFNNLLEWMAAKPPLTLTRSLLAY